MSSPAPPTTKRPYLRPEARKRHLLDATGAVVRREGLHGVTMVAVAAEAAVSRRLLYNHFPDLATLVRAYVVDRLAGYVELTEVEFAQTERSSLELAHSLFQRIRTVAREDRQVLRTLLTGVAPSELEPVRLLVESTVASRWAHARPAAAADALTPARALLGATLALAIVDLLDRQVITVEQANAFVVESAALLPK